MRALNVPDTLPAEYSTSLFTGTGIVVSVVQVIAPSDPEPAIGKVCGQHSIATAPAVTLPLPWTLKVRKRGAGSVTVLPLPVVELT
jgi:hypothetical protein